METVLLLVMFGCGIWAFVGWRRRRARRHDEVEVAHRPGATRRRPSGSLLRADHTEARGRGKWSTSLRLVATAWCVLVVLGIVIAVATDDEAKSTVAPVSEQVAAGESVAEVEPAKTASSNDGEPAGAATEAEAPEPSVENTPAPKAAEPEPSRIAEAKDEASTTLASAADEESFSGTSPTCGPIVGETQQDLQNVEEFCEAAIPEGLTEGVYAMESLLWVKVPYEIATYMIDNTLETEQLVRTWMEGWKQLSESQSVTIWVEWQDTEIAKGETTVFSGDQVTVRK